MIYGIGVDLAKIDRMDRVLKRWGDRFVGRIFTKAEAELCLSRASPHSAFSLRFAAKEAFSKALGLGMRGGLRWRDIEVFHHPGGQPSIRPHGKANEICREREICSIHLSLSDDGDYGVAVVVLEKPDEIGQSL